MFRFTIRDVLWLTVVVALAVAWWLDHSHTSGQYRAAKAEAQAARSGWEANWKTMRQVADHAYRVETQNKQLLEATRQGTSPSR